MIGAPIIASAPSPTAPGGGGTMTEFLLYLGLAMVLSWANLSALNGLVVGKLVGLEGAGIIRQAEGLANHLIFLKRIGERLAYPALARIQESRAAVVRAVEEGRLYQFALGAWPWKPTHSTRS